MEFNPFEMPKAMFAEFEKGLGAYLEKTMRDPAFMKLVSKNMVASLDVQALVKKNMAQVLETMDVPTNATLAGLYQTVHNLETRLLDLEEKVEDLEAQAARAVAPAKPVAPVKPPRRGRKA